MKVVIKPNAKEPKIHVKPQSETVAAEITKGSVRSAKKLETPRRIGLIGDIHGYNYFDGSEDIDITTNATVISNIEIEEMFANG